MHVLLIISIFLTVFSSSLITLIFENEKIYKAICYFAAIIFAQIILTYELLSIYSLIKPFNIIIINVVFFIISLIFFRYYGKRTKFLPEIQNELKGLKQAIKKDKWLRAVFICFLIFIAGSIIFMYMMPVNDEDALSYHVARLPFWYSSCNLKHFITADIRALIMPINSEIFYFWAYSFIKSDIFVRLFSFLSYLLFGIALRGFLKELGYSFRIFLWVFFGISAMQNVMFAITGTETNITIAGLILAALFMFFDSIKTRNRKSLYFSSLLYALAAGTKTPALMVLPSIFLILIVISYIYQRKNFYKPISLFLIFFIFNFLIFSSYNYILNYIDFGNFLTSSSGAEMHRFEGGIKGFFANIIRYGTMFFDFSGTPIGVQIWRITVSCSMFIMVLFGIQPDTNIIIPDTKYFELGNNFENMCGLGILSFLVFIPSLIIALKRLKKHIKSKKTIILGTIAAGFIINIIVLSCSLGYMIFSVRFIMFFVMLASPIMVYLFLFKNKGFYKKFIAIIIMYSFTWSYFFYERRFSPYLMYVFYKNPSIEKFKKQILCANVDFDESSQACRLIQTVKKQPGNVLYFASSGTNIYYPKHSENNNLNIDIALLETSDEQNIMWDKYTYIAVPNIQLNTNIQYKNQTISNNSKLFENCNFVNFRHFDKKLSMDKKYKITSSRCKYKPEILEKYGFKLIEKIDNYDKTNEEQINLYKKN